MKKNTVNIKGNITINITFYQLPNGALTTSKEEMLESKRNSKHNN